MFDSNKEISNYVLNLLNTNPKLVQSQIYKEGQKLNYRSDFYKFKEYIDNFLENETLDRFFILPGLRGVGKTTLLFQLFDYLISEKNISKDRVLFLDLDRLKDLPDFNILDYLDYFIREFHEAFPVVEDHLFIFIDESQYASNWASVGKIIFDENKKVFLIFTGSNALNLEVNKDAARRAITHQIYPLNFSEYLFLKYDLEAPGNSEKILSDLIFSGNIDDAISLEKELDKNISINLPRGKYAELENFLSFGEFPFAFDRSKEVIINLTLDLKDRVIEKDIDLINSFTSPSRLATYKLINLLAMMKPGDISLNKLANLLDINKDTVNSILNTLEKTQLLFHIEPYGSPAKRNRKSWKYYFLSNQIKSNIYLKNGQASRQSKEFDSLMAENMVASSLYKLKLSTGQDFGIFYDSNKRGVDFLISTLFGDVIPIEVGLGNKDNKQIKLAMKYYGSDYGIIVSDSFEKITKEDNIIKLPLFIFSFI